MRNESFAYEHGIIVQEFINPGGYHFDLVTVKRSLFNFVRVFEPLFSSEVVQK